MTAPGELKRVRAEAADLAAEAARRSGVVVGELTTIEEHQEACDLFEKVWEAPEGYAPMSASLVRAATHVGSYTAGAFAEGRMVGAAFGFFAADGHLHSHIAGVLPDYQGRGVGFALKLHQRVWALQRGIDLVSWTFDPLVRRNAYFNIHRLGVDLVSYLPLFYGEMPDGVNVGDDTDRILAQWYLASPTVIEAVTRRRPETEVADLGEDVSVVVGEEGGAPVTGDIPDAGVLLVAVPADIEAIRPVDPDLAGAWRRAVRWGLGTALERGYRITAMSKDGWYLLEAP